MHLRGANYLRKYSIIMLKCKEIDDDTFNHNMIIYLLNVLSSMEERGFSTSPVPV